MYGQSDPHIFHIKSSRGVRGEVGGVHRDTHKGCNGGKIQAMVTSHYFIVRKVVLLGVSYNCGKITKHMTCPHAYIYFKFIWNGFHNLHWIINSYGKKITPLSLSRHQCLPCLHIFHHHGNNTNEKRKGN